MNQNAVTPGQAWGTWKTVSEISPRVIIDEAALSVTLAVVASEACFDWLVGELVGADASEAERAVAATVLKRIDSPPDFDAAGFYTFTLYVTAADDPIGVRGKNAVPFSGELNEVIEWLLKARPDLCIALSRALRRFRAPACDLLIQRASRANAQIAFLSAVPKLVPFPTPFLPISSLADVILLTKNQAMLIMRLAAAFGQRPGYDRQVKELLGTVAAALGWRTLARELIDFVPLGVGAALKAAIAYSGTVAVGKAAVFYYETGIKPTPEQIRAFEKEAKSEGEASAKELE
jgi:uncharacterized protein (DUF697 family)